MSCMFRIVCITMIFHVHWDPSGGQQADKSWFVIWALALRNCVGFQVMRSVICCSKILNFIVSIKRRFCRLTIS
jgi:hypothetical protein